MRILLIWLTRWVKLHLNETFVLRQNVLAIEFSKTKFDYVQTDTDTHRELVCQNHCLCLRLFAPAPLLHDMGRSPATGYGPRHYLFARSAVYVVAASADCKSGGSDATDRSAKSGWGQLLGGGGRRPVRFRPFSLWLDGRVFVFAPAPMYAIVR